MTRRSSRRALLITAAALAALSLCFCAYAVRANWGTRQLGRLEQMGHHEDAAFYFRTGLDFWAVIQQLWMEAVYDPGVDDIYRQYARPFGTAGWRSADHEEHHDTAEACLVFFNRDGVERNVIRGRFSPAQMARLEDRCRIYIEDLIDPDHGSGGDFSFARKAWILERTGLFWHAAFRRELAGRYAMLVCARYYAAIGDEMERVFRDPARARLYRQRATEWRARGLDELHVCNGDRALSRLAGGDRLKRLDRPGVLAVLRKGLRDPNVDARRAAVRILSDMRELAPLEQAMKDREVGIRRAAAATFADRMYLPGLALALQDEAPEVSSVAKEVLNVKAESAGPYLRAAYFLGEGLKNERTRAFAARQLRRLSGLRLADDAAGWRNWVRQATRRMQPGALVEYFSAPGQTRPVAARIFETIDIGMKLQANFPKVWYNYWEKARIFPANARGQFRLRITARLYVPADGSYRFYVKTEVPNRARVSIGAPRGRAREIISPRNDRKLQYVVQVGMPTHRIDFSEPVPLRKGLARLVILYEGSEVRKTHNRHIVRISGVQKAGIQLFWSSDRHLAELVPGANLFH